MLFGRRSAVWSGSMVLAVALTVASPGSTVAAQDTSRADLVADLDSIARAAVLSGQVVGRSVAVIQGRDTLLLTSYGLGNIELDVATPAAAVYEIGSVTKQFTAAAILQLVEAGKLDLDSLITRYLPQYPLHGRRITVRHLLNHTSGIKGFTEMPAFNIAMDELSRDSLVSMFAAEPFTFEPGTAAIYNNSAYFLLGRLIEKVSGTSYEDYIEQDVFAHLGMHQSAYCSNSKVLKNKVTGYVYDDNDFQRAGYISHRWPYAAGSLCASVGDLVTWLLALHGGRVLSPEMYREMTTPARLSDGTELRYGMGVYIGEDPAGQMMIGHGGAIPGYLSEARYYPDNDLYVVVLQNTNTSSAPEVVADALAERILGHLPSQTQVSLRDPARYVGAYVGVTRSQPDAVVHIEQGEHGLTYRTGDGSETPLRHIGNMQFIADAPRSRWPYVPLLLEFRGNAGQIAELRLDSGYNHVVLKKQ